MKKEVSNATLRLAVYDPLQLDEQDFLNTFVARHAVLKRLKRQISENIGKSMFQHRLVFGQRGMGKTSLLRRLALEVRDDETLSRHWIPLNFREEQYNIGKLDHFWQNCADVLADWCEKQGDIEGAGALDEAIHSGLNLYETIRTVTKKYNRCLLLLVDNMNLILDSLPVKDQWALREKLQDRNAPLMIACTPSHVPQLSDREGPFYDFFAMDDLQPLTPYEMRDCLARLAETRGKSGQVVLSDMRRFPARIKVMHTLCGGNPRTLVLIYQVLETIVAITPESHGDIGPLLEGVLETTTPLYKARTEELPPQQRQIIDTVALEWDPVHSSTIAQRTGLPPGSISSQLKRLENDGFLQQVSLGAGKKGFQLAERFYNIWYLMRHGTRRNRQRLRWLSSFLSSYYSETELCCQAKNRICGTNICRNLYSEALMHALNDEPLKDALRQALTRPLIGVDGSILQKLFPGEDYEPKILDHTERQAKMMKGLMKAGMDEKKAREMTQLIAESISISTEEKQSIADKAERLKMEQAIELEKILNNEKQRFETILGKDTAHALRHSFGNGTVASLDDIKGAMVALAATENSGLLDAFLSVGIFMKGDLDDLNWVLTYCHATPPKISYAWHGLGKLLQDHFNRYEESEQAYRKAIDLNPEDARPWNGLGNLLQDHFNRYDESEKAYLQSEAIDPTEYSPKGNRAWLKLKFGDHTGAREIVTGISFSSPGPELLLAACDLVSGNPGACCEQLEPIFRENPVSLWDEFRDDLLRLTRLVKDNHFEKLYMAFLHDKQFNLSLEPYVAATEAFFSGHDRLLRLNPESRSVAESLYAWLTSEKRGKS